MGYPTDLTDSEWNLIASCFPRPATTGRPRRHAARALRNALFSLLRPGCQWRNLPKDLPPWPTVYDYFRQWERTRLIEPIHTQRRDHLRLLEGRPPLGYGARFHRAASPRGGRTHLRLAGPLPPFEP